MPAGRRRCERRRGGSPCCRGDRTTAPPDSANWNWWERSEARTGDAVSATASLSRVFACRSYPSPDVVDLTRELLVESAQEFHELLMPVSLVAFADDFALQRVQCGEQSCCSVALVIVGRRSATPLFYGQSRLRQIQRLNLAFFVNAKHHSLLRRIQIQTHDVGHLLQKLRITRQLESPGKMRLQLMRAPNAVDRGLADALIPGHGPATPVRHPRRFGLRGRLHDGGDLIDSIQGLSSPARSNIPKSVQPLLRKAPPPKNYGVPVHRKFLRNSDIGLPRCCRCHHPATQSHLLWRSMRRHPLRKLLLIRRRRLT